MYRLPRPCCVVMTTHPILYLTLTPNLTSNFYVYPRIPHHPSPSTCTVREGQEVTVDKEDPVARRQDDKDRRLSHIVILRHQVYTLTYSKTSPPPSTLSKLQCQLSIQSHLHPRLHPRIITWNKNICCAIRFKSLSLLLSPPL